MNIIDEMTDAAANLQRAANCTLGDLPTALREGLRWQMHPRAKRALYYACVPSDGDLKPTGHVTGRDKFRDIEIETLVDMNPNEVRLCLVFTQNQDTEVRR